MLLLMSMFFSIIGFSQSGPNKTEKINADSLTNSTAKSRINLSSKVSLKIFPNPATNKISLQVSGFKQGLVMVKISDEKGNIHSADSRLLTTNDNEITMFLQLRQGVYFVSVTQQNRSVKKRLLVL